MRCAALPCGLQHASSFSDARRHLAITRRALAGDALITARYLASLLEVRLAPDIFWRLSSLPKLAALNCAAFVCVPCFADRFLRPLQKLDLFGVRAGGTKQARIACCAYRRALAPVWLHRRADASSVHAGPHRDRFGLRWRPINGRRCLGSSTQTS